MSRKKRTGLLLLFYLLMWITVGFSCQNREGDSVNNEFNSGHQKESPEDQKILTINWYGHACFMITKPGGTKILLDPVEFKGYHMPEGIEPDIVTISHNHPDHNRTDVLTGNPDILQGCSSDNQSVNKIDTLINEIHLYTVPSHHDPGKHGVNAIFVFELDGVKIAHLGDLGTTLTQNQIEAIDKVDILMIPVGGQFTIAGTDAENVIDQLNVKSFVFPMHYKTEAFSLPYSAEDFIQGKENCRRISGNEFKVDILKLPEEREIIVLDYE